MSEVEFILSLKITSKLSLNNLYSGSHWIQRQRQAKRIHRVVKHSLELQSVPQKIFENPVHIKFFWHSNLDLDNHGYLTKLIIDSLIGYLICDDSKKYVQKISHGFWQEHGVKISVSEVQIES